MPKKELLARTKELGIESQVPEGATNKEISDLIKIAEHPILKKKLKESKDALKEANETIGELKTQIEESKGNSKEGDSTNKPSFKNEEGEYYFSVDVFRFKGSKITAEDAVEDSDLMESLIESGFVHLKKK